MIKVLITGAGGQLGKSLQSRQPTGVDAEFLTRDAFDLADEHSMQQALIRVRPDVVVNCAAFTNVDGAESDVENATEINHLGPLTLAGLCADHQSKLIHVSTDFVFSGESLSPYATGATCDPIGVYGRTKYAGELAVRKRLPKSSVIIRTSWLYSEFGSNFVRTMLKLFATKESFRVVDDQSGSPTYAGGLAEVIWHIIKEEKFSSGVYHWSDSGITSWFKFAVEIGEQAAMRGLLTRRAEVTPITAAEYPSVAPRPAFSALDCSDLITMYPQLIQETWQDNLSVMLDNLELFDG